MNFKNLVMWGIIVLLTVGLYNMFKYPQASIGVKNNIYKNHCNKDNDKRNNCSVFKL